MLVIFGVVAIAIGATTAERDVVPSKAVCATYPNEEFAVDLHRCQNTCQYYGRRWDCPLNYKPFGDCYCKIGFARISDDYGKCVSVKNNAKCVSQLPIQPESCTGPHQVYKEFIDMNDRYESCRTFGYYVETDGSKRWAPHCYCTPDGFKKLSDGTCVHASSPQCAAEYQPSQERCSAIGQIFAMNAPCQPAVNGGSYCPPPGPTCICPNNQVQKNYEGGYYTEEIVNGENVIFFHPVPMMRCVIENYYSFTTSAPRG
ncbi:hypothetical protein Bhyg_15180 [Pseudolycoriella hygida]|uniref:Uncharacterized protein n=1 Tax=Pseudolycoriella hygida TaxID=35572 RepID=A0A9Q0MT84_9DIPT|nr:hypothetical protein Bhyg_15180 [Pseudolycoriella hygida]